MKIEIWHSVQDTMSTILSWLKQNKDALQGFGAVANPAITFIAGLIIARLQIINARRQKEIEIETSEERNQQEALKSYFLQATNLLSRLDEDLLPEEDADSTSLDQRATSVTILRALTQAVMRELDSERNGQIAIFLSEAGLIQAGSQASLLKRAQLEGVNLDEAYLKKADLHQAYLKKANLQKAFLRNADLQGAVLVEANLEEADLQGAKLQRAVLKKAKLTGARYSVNHSQYSDTVFPEGFDPKKHEMIRKS